ncbi:MAG TPA: LLM class flavin-dependent oxidoreductase [candidate division Zixibacteria bacterium]|nr:LLM class flavin-dependent oxidoreductase [candidate division Zixibacteria bacterium]
MNFCLHGSARTVGESIRRAQLAERLGYEAIFFADSHMNNVDCYQVMAMCAMHTKTIRLGTAVTNMVYRDPTIIANAFATLNEISGGRAIIGIGTGDGPVYSLGRTATRLADFEKGLAAIRDLLHDRGIEVPRTRERPGGGRVWLRAGKRPVPLYISAEGPRTLEVAGRTCDGVILGAGVDPSLLPWARARIAEGARRAGRDPEAIDLMPAGMICVDDDGERACRRVRARMANRAHHNFRFTYETVPEGALDGVKRFMESFDISKPIEERVDPELVTDYLLRRFAIAGTPAECAAQIRRLEEAGVRRVLLTPPNALYDETMEAWSRRVMPLCR